MKTVLVLFSLLILVSCGDPAEPSQSDVSILSAGVVSHFHTELSWTKHNTSLGEFSSYNLFRSTTPGIENNQSSAELLASFQDIEKMEHTDDSLRSGIDYYYALRIDVNGTGMTRGSSLWSNEEHVKTDEVVHVTIVNNSGYKDMYIGLRSDDGRWMQDIGDCSRWLADATSPAYLIVPKDSSREFSYPNPIIEGTTHAARIYISEAQWTHDTGPDLANDDFIFDKVETTFGAIWNTTCVDFVGIPMQLTDGTETVGFKSSITREALFSQLASLEGPYPQLGHPVAGSGTDVYRYFSPGFANLSSFDTLLDASIQRGIDAFAECASFAYTGGSYTYTNIKRNGSHSMSALASGGSKGSETILLNNITTHNCLACIVDSSTVVDPNNSQAARFAALFYSAANRGILEAANPNQDWGIRSNYYTNGECNQYSKLLHDNSLETQQKCYGFAFDDIYHWDSSIDNVGAGSSVTVTIMPFQ